MDSFQVPCRELHCTPTSKMCSCWLSCTHPVHITSLYNVGLCPSAVGFKCPLKSQSGNSAVWEHNNSSHRVYCRDSRGHFFASTSMLRSTGVYSAVGPGLISKHCHPRAQIRTGRVMTDPTLKPLQHQRNPFSPWSIFASPVRSHLILPPS